MGAASLQPVSLPPESPNESDVENEMVDDLDAIIGEIESTWNPENAKGDLEMLNIERNKGASIPTSTSR